VRSQNALIGTWKCKEAAMGTSKNEHGEGNYKASRQYNDATKKFVESGRVEQAAQDAQPESEVEALEMANAVAEGRRRAKEEDPALKHKARKDADKGSEEEPQGKPITDRSAEETRTPEPGEETE
jgi:hypothetical protein